MQNRPCGKERPSQTRNAAPTGGSLLADARSDEFVSGFVHQWLHMERLDFFQFDTKLHREFDESVRASARREVYESFAHPCVILTLVALVSS